MTKGLTRTPTTSLTKEEWLECRRASIGGSDASAIIGLNEWSSPYRVWAEKTGRIPDKEDNEAMRQGRDLEGYVATRWCEATGRKARRDNAILRNPEYPFAHANIDRLVVGEDAGLECKTTSALNMKRFKDGEYPANYYVQCVHYMAVTGASRWYLAVLILNKDFLLFTIERDEDEIRSLMGQESEFWDHVRTDMPPPADGTDATTEAMKIIYADSVAGGSVALFGRDKLIDRYYQYKADRDAADAEMERIRQTLMEDLGDNETGLCTNYKVTWKLQNRRTFDDKAFASEHPGIDISKYYRTSKFRKFDIRAIKE